MIFIEAIIVDFLHVQFVWIIFAIYNFSNKIEKKIRDKNGSA